LSAPERFALWEWEGHHFRRHADYFGDITFRVGVTQIETLAGGKQNLHVTLPATTKASATTRLFSLANGTLTRTPPRSTDDAPRVSAALDALFVKRDARSALEFVNAFEGNKPILLYVRALAYEYAGERERARSEFRALLEKFPDSEWSALAQTHSK